MNNIGTIHSLKDAKTICQVPQLPASVLSVFDMKYRHKQGEEAVAALSQGEIDVLELCRQALGWHSIYSLAYKYYPLYPHRKLWQFALDKCKRAKVRTVTLNIRYLLLAVITQVKLSLEKSYSSTCQAAIRLTQHLNTNSIEGIRLTQPGEEKHRKRPPVDPDKYIKGKYGHLVRR